MAASGIRRSTPVSHNSLRVCGRAQTACGLPPCAAARRAAPTSAPSPAESMNVTRVQVHDQRLPAVRQPAQALPQRGHGGKPATFLWALLAAADENDGTIPGRMTRDTRPVRNNLEPNGPGHQASSAAVSVSSGGSHGRVGSGQAPPSAWQLAAP